MRYAVLIVHGHEIMRDRIAAIVKPSRNFDVVGKSANGSDAAQLCQALRPAIVIIDTAVPGLNAIEATTEILRHMPDTKIVILSRYAAEPLLMDVIRTGARVFVLSKASNNDSNHEPSAVAAIRRAARAFVGRKAFDNDLLNALRTVANGGSYLSSELSDRLLQGIQRGDIEGLSPRELQILRLIIK